MDHVFRFSHDLSPEMVALIEHELLLQQKRMIETRIPLLVYTAFDGQADSLIATIRQQSLVGDGNYYRFDGRLNDHREAVVLCETLSGGQISGMLHIKNIEMVPLELQKRLAECLASLASDRVRLIVSTTAPLFRLMEQGVFCSDLFYHINRMPFEIPADFSLTGTQSA